MSLLLQCVCACVEWQSSVGIRWEQTRGLRMCDERCKQPGRSGFAVM